MCVCVCMKVCIITLAKLSRIVLNKSKIGILFLALSSGDTSIIFQCYYRFFFLCLFNGIIGELYPICYFDPFSFCFKTIYDEKSNLTNITNHPPPLKVITQRRISKHEISVVVREMEISLC